MNYFRINYTLDSKIRGCNNDIVKDYKYHSSTYNQKFIGMIHFQKVDFEPIPVNPILFSKAKKTDLIQGGGQLSGKLLISSKLKSILEKNDFGVQYFQNSIIHKNEEFREYWVVNPYEFINESIDFKNSKIIHEKRKEDFETTYEVENIIINVSSLNEYELKLNEVIKNDEMLYIEKVKLNTNQIKVDFFVLRYVSGGCFYVSEKLKKEIEDAGCTGIEFQPAELSYNEWMLRDGPRDQIYGRSW